MANDDDGSFRLSRRKALAGLGSIGMAGALGVGGTYAQFTDTEGQTATFSAGGIDGTITTNASYNGEQLNGNEQSGYVTYDGEGAGATINFDDVKPGDYGSFNFTLEVRNNPAWIAACLAVTRDADGLNFEPEVEEDGNISSTNVNENAEYDGSGGRGQPGELAENVYIIPFYDSDDTSQFFDSGGPPASFNPNTGVSAPSDFWSNSQDGPLSASVNGTDNYLAPRPITQVVQQKFEGTTTFNANQTSEFQTINAPDGTDLDDGCILLDGGINDSETTNNTQEASALQPGTAINFGFDWHLPFTVGNVAQGDEMTVKAGFTFSQVRHSSGPKLQNVYAPGNNTPSTDS